MGHEHTWSRGDKITTRAKSSGKTGQEASSSLSVAFASLSKRPHFAQVCTIAERHPYEEDVASDADSTSSSSCFDVDEVPERSCAASSSQQPASSSAAPAHDEGNPASRAASSSDIPAVVPNGGGSRGDKYQRAQVGCGVVVINTASQSLDANCCVCGASKDRKWYSRHGARAPSTRAQGRPMGSLIAWLHLPNGCPGSKRAHNAAWSSLPFSDRRRWRLQYVETPELEAFFAKERLPWEDEEDGEPAAVPRSAVATRVVRCRDAAFSHPS